DSRTLRSHPFLLPGLKHENSPKFGRPVLLSTKVFGPRLANRHRIEYALLSQFSGVKKFFNPRAKRAAEPLTQGQAKPHLRTLEKPRRDIPSQNRPKNPLHLSSTDFEVQGQSPCEFHKSIIQEWHSGFKTNS